MTIRDPAHIRPGLVHFALAVGGFAIGTTEFATMSLLRYFARDLHIDEPTAGHVISSYALGVVVGAPVIAVLSARVTRRSLLIGLMIVFALGNLLSASSPTYSWMLVSRFLSGLPHGAFFGIATLVAASLVPTEKRTQAVGRVLLGLTVATIMGVPLANWMGRVYGWRWAFVIVAALALLCAILIASYAPRDRTVAGASPLRELGALKRPQVWLTLATGAIGFGGVFAVYTYLGSTLIDVTHVSAATATLVFCIFGVGMTAGNLVVPRFADRALMPTAGLLLAGSAVVLALYPFAAANFWTVTADMFLIGVGGALATVLQTRLMDVAGEAQSLAAALNHSAFNVANALGPWLGGLAIAAGFGLTSTGYVGCALAIGGLVVWGISQKMDWGKHRSVAALLIMACSMIGCGRSDHEPPPTEKNLGQKVVNVYFWSDYLAPETIASFEKQTGIKVNISYFDSYETLEARVLTGHSGFDVVLPGTDIFGREIRSGAYLPLDKSKLPNLINLDPAIMSKVLSSDPGNAHGVVYMWSSYGIGFNKKSVAERLTNAPVTSWRLLLDPLSATKLASCGINVIDDPVGIVQIILNYLRRDPAAPSPKDFADVENVLMKVRPFIRTIDTSGEIEAMANGDICISLGYSGDFVQANKRAKEAKNGIELAYFIPKEGSLIGFDLLAIPKDATHVANAYQFINYLMNPQVAAKISNAIGYANANLTASPLLDASIAANTTIYPTQQEQQRLFAQVEVSSEQSRTITRIWQRFRTGQ